VEMAQELEEVRKGLQRSADNIEAT